MPVRYLAFSVPMARARPRRSKWSPACCAPHRAGPLSAGSTSSNSPSLPSEHRAEELLRLFDLTNDANNLIESFSHGMRQKTAIAGALMHDPKVLVLDEPTAGLDPKSARLIKDILLQLAERGAAVFLSTHILEIAERMCDRIGIIDHGQLVAVGTMEELRLMGSGKSSLEDIFLGLTGGAEEAEIAEVLK